MLRICIYIVKILIISYSIALIIQSLSDYGLKNSEDNIFSHWKSILKGKIDSEIIILGSSRGVVSYDPKIFSKQTELTTFNLSFDAAPYNLQRIKLEAYLEKNAVPKVIIQNVDMAHFNKSYSIPNKFQFIPFMGKNTLQEELKKVDPDFGKYYTIPLVKYNGSVNFLKIGLLNIFNERSSTQTFAQAYNPKNLQFKKDIHNLERLDNLENSSRGFDRFKPGLDALEEILNEIPSETIVFLVWAPEHFERLKYAKHFRSKIEKRLEELNNAHSNVHYLNYSRDSISLHSNLYYDTFHLNKKGATIFSEKVSKDIFEILK